MRHIRLEELIKTILADPGGNMERRRLAKAHKKLIPMVSRERQRYIRNNGSNKWSPIKKRLTKLLGNKCWYTEAELVGAHLTIDHYRPCCDYWFLAFDATNYRVSCSFANSPEDNATQGRVGGKGDSFPLIGRGLRATGRNKVRFEKPLILDPCKKEDCDLLAFGAGGRPILNPKYAADPMAVRRVDESKLLLNLDHHDFNSKREQLYHDIADDVRIYEELPAGSPGRTIISDRMKTKLGPKAAFSTAARYYLQLHRHLDWVEDLLAGL